MKKKRMRSCGIRRLRNLHLTREKARSATLRMPVTMKRTSHCCAGHSKPALKVPGGIIMLKIYGSVNSRAMRVLWMASELGLAYEHKDWLPRAPETKTPEFRTLNANGRVPTIDDDGFVLSESMAINLYLAKKHKSPLYPTDPKKEALALQWSLWETDRLDRQVVDYQRHKSQLPEAERKPELA